MKLQEKTSLILVALLVFCLAGISIFVASISLSSYSALEQTYIERDITLAAERIAEESSTLSIIASDWGPWDDTYDFLGGEKPEYIQTNLLPETYYNLRLNLIIITDRSGTIVYAGAYNLTTGRPEPVPESIREHLRPGLPLMAMDDPESGTDGIVILPEGPLMVASRPILRTDLSGTPRGVVIMGRYLDENEIARLARFTSPSLTAFRLSDPAVPREVFSAPEDRHGRFRSMVSTLSETEAGGYAVLKDIYGSESLVIRILQDRDIYQQGVTTTLQYIFIVLAAGLLFGVTVLFILDRLVLSRIIDLSRQVSEIGQSTDSPQRISIGGNDEFAGLALEINRMLETIEKTRRGLVASESRFRELAELLPQTIFEMDRTGRLLYVNRAGTEIFGITEEKIRDGVNVRQFLIPEDHARMQRGLAAILSGATSSGQIYSFVKKDNELMRGIVYTAPVRRKENPDGFQGIVIDVTDRVNLEEALIESQEYLQTLFMSVRAGILVIDALTHTIVDANPAALDMIGTTRDELIDRECQGLVCPSQAGECPVTDFNIILDNAERSLLTKDGRSVSVIKYVVPVMLHGRACLLETFIDNSLRRQMEEELRESRERLSGILRASPVGVFETTKDGILIYVNERWEEMTGLTRESAQGKRWTSTIHPHDRSRVEEEIREYHQRQQILRTEARFIRPDKTILWVYGQAVPLYDADGTVRGYAGTITDITDRKRDEDAVQLANKKLNLMNNITRHDILNTITGLLGCVDMAKATKSTDERVELLNEIRDLTRVIQRQIAFTKEYQEVGVHLPVWQNVNTVISRIRQNFTSSGISLAVELENVEVYADPLLEKVFYNLVDNAIRYGEHIHTISFYFEISDKGLFIICEDDGIGIPPEAKARIFERGVGRNTGMGLFLSREILGITGITIEENGEHTKGARFEIHIPRGTFRFVRDEKD